MARTTCRAVPSPRCLLMANKQKHGLRENVHHHGHAPLSLSVEYQLKVPDMCNYVPPCSNCALDFACRMEAEQRENYQAAYSRLSKK